MVSSQKPALYLKFYGVSPWELEVLYSILHNLFQVTEDKQEQPEDDFTTMVDIVFPLAFNEAFFKWFGRPRWEKTKAILKELKRRRGPGKAFRLSIRFSGTPSVRFMLDIPERSLFDSAMDKIDFVLELLPYHLDPQKIPSGTSEAVYFFDDSKERWNINYEVRDGQSQ